MSAPLLNIPPLFCEMLGEGGVKLIPCISDSYAINFQKLTGSSFQVCPLNDLLKCENTFSHRQALVTQNRSDFSI